MQQHRPAEIVGDEVMWPTTRFGSVGGTVDPSRRPVAVSGTTPDRGPTWAPSPPALVRACHGAPGHADPQVACWTGRETARDQVFVCGAPHCAR